MYKKNDRVVLEREDEDLIKLIRDGNKLAYDALYRRYKGFIYDVSYRFMVANKIAQMYLDDLIDVATECLIDSIKNYTIGEQYSFLNYWWAITEKNHMRFLKKIIDSRTFVYDPYLMETNEVLLFDSSAFSSTDFLALSLLEIIEQHKELFGEDEMIFIQLFLQGYKPLEIAEKLSWNKPKVYRTKKNAMLKLNKIIKSN